MIWFEYVYDCSKIAREKGLKNVYVTNGFINQEPLLELLKYADAMNIDLKSFQEDTYKSVQKGKLSNVLQTIQTAHERCHVEITTLIVTGINDTIDEMKSIIDWISSLDKNIPWHISRYHPSYKYNAPATDVDFMLEVYDESIKKLNYVFCGNISGSYGRSDTSCPSCKSVVISRSGYFTSINNLANGKCGSCGYDLKIVQ
jgi:pyruvate formate lyase activating enzyme